MAPVVEVAMGSTRHKQKRSLQQLRFFGGSLDGLVIQGSKSAPIRLTRAPQSLYLAPTISTIPPGWWRDPDTHPAAVLLKKIETSRKNAVNHYQENGYLVYRHKFRDRGVCYYVYDHWLHPPGTNDPRAQGPRGPRANGPRANGPRANGPRANGPRAKSSRGRR